MSARNVIDLINEIESAVLVEASFGVGMENRIKIKVHSEKDYLKWDYFIEKVKGRKIPLKIVKQYPIITFVFPRYTSELEDA